LNIVGNKVFIRATLCVSAVFAVIACLSVRLSVCHTPVLYLNGKAYRKTVLNIW